jgi:hypothetical protein
VFDAQAWEAEARAQSDEGRVTLATPPEYPVPLLRGLQALEDRADLDEELRDTYGTKWPEVEAKRLIRAGERPPKAPTPGEA